MIPVINFGTNQNKPDARASQTLLPSPLSYLLAKCLCCFLLVFNGCNQGQKLITEYGKVVGYQGTTSVNGTSILAGMLLNRGFEIKRLKKISPKLEKYETIIWIPDNEDCPDQKAITALEDWLRNGYERTLIYVGRDYDAQRSYLTQLTEQQSTGDLEEFYRELAEVKLKQDQRRRSLLSRDDEFLQCQWFDLEVLPRHRAKNLTQTMAADVNDKRAEVEIATVLKPPKKLVESEWTTVETLLQADEVDFVYSISENDQSAGAYGGRANDNRIIIVSNGSFLLNFGLVNHENRKLAGALIDQITNPYSEVVLLESGPMGITVTDKDAINQNAWAWISEPPLRYIVPHFLLWGVLFCFVFFPIFGRAKKLKRKPLAIESEINPNAGLAPILPSAESTTSFRSHIVAVGKLLQRSGESAFAAEKIRRYQETFGKESNLKQDKK